VLATSRQVCGSQPCNGSTLLLRERRKRTAKTALGGRKAGSVGGEIAEATKEARQRFPASYFSRGELDAMQRDHDDKRRRGR